MRFKTMVLTSVAVLAARSVNSFAPNVKHGVIRDPFRLMSTFISFEPMSTDPDATVLIGKKNILKSMAMMDGLEESVVDAMLSSGSSSSTWLPSGKKLSLCTLPETVTRNNHPLSIHKITSMVQSEALTKGTTLVKIGGVQYSAPMAGAIARAFPLYSRKTNTPKEDDRTIAVACFDDELHQVSSSAEEAVAEGVRLACRLIDMTPEELTTEVFAEECRLVANRFDCVVMREIVGEELNEKGYGGLYGVGKAAVCPPRLVVLEYDPPSESKETVALVGKGIVYDTGGLSLKSKEGMPGMKHDMGGAAGMLGAFLAAVSLKVDRKLKLILCLAENAIGPKAVRNDDILTLYSGKTVEINNSDAEGRVVLGDGVAHATKHFDCDVVIDMATLTGAQLVTTGKMHAGILANSIELEQRAIRAGLISGDLVFPMLYAPELLKTEFESKVADMKNSVKDRSNAQSSCAGHFIESHLSEDFKGGWLHVDMAGPGDKDQRGTGYGVALMLALLEAEGFR